MAAPPPGGGQRVTAGRMVLVDVLVGAQRPITFPEILERAPIRRRVPRIGTCSCWKRSAWFTAS